MIFGAAALGHVSQADADRTLELLLEYGINHIDTAASYGDAELRIARGSGARVLPGDQDRRAHLRRRARPDPALAGAAAGRSRRLDPAPQPGRRDRVGHALGPGGALEACIEAREEGLVRFIGVTGHGLSVPEMHQRSLERFAFDSCCARTATCRCGPALRGDVRRAGGALRRAQRRGADDQEPHPRAVGGREHTAATWYEPLHRPGRHRPAPCTGCSATRRSSSHRRRRRCCRSCSTPPRASGPAAPTRRWRALDLAPLFT